MRHYRIKYFSLLTIGFWVAFSTPAVRGQVSITTVEGTQIAGELVSWNTDRITISSGDTSTDISTDQLLTIQWQEQKSNFATDSPTIELVDGSLLPITTYEVDDSQATVSTPLSDSKLSIPTADIRRVQFTSLTDQLSALWEELEEKQLAGDLLVVHKKKGTVLDYLTGLVGDVSAEQVLFNWEGDKIPVKWSKVAAIAYYHAKETKIEPAICWLQVNNGARLPIASVTLRDSIVDLVTVGGIRLLLPIDSIAAADFSHGKLRYLSDLEPLKQVWTPRVALPVAVEFIQNFGKPRRDQSFAGSALTLTWPQAAQDENPKSIHSTELRTYSKGLAIRSRTEIVYRLPQQMQRFVASAGIDPNTASQGSVILEISADNQVVWQGEVAGSSPPVEIDVQLEGAKQLRILVDYGDNLDFGDRLHLVDARVTK